MDTRRTTRVGVPEAEDTTAVGGSDTAEDAIDQPGLGASTPQQLEEGEPSTEGLRQAHAKLAELLYAAAAMLDNITRLGAAGPPRGDSSQRPQRLPAISTGQHFETPAIAAAAVEGVAALSIASNGRSTVPAASPPTGGTSPRVRPAMPSLLRADAESSEGDEGARSSSAAAALHQRLPPLKEFVGEDGDWGGFQRRFLAHQEMAQWTDAEALRALPALLDSDALATLTSAPKERRSTLRKAMQVLSAVYGPPSDCRQLFYDRQRGTKESPLAYRTSLLALAKEAFPRMDDEGVDAMVTEKILLLADDLDIVIVAQDDAEMCSLQAARLLHANLSSQRRKANKAASGRAVAAATLPVEAVCAIDHRRQHGAGVREDRAGSSRLQHPSSPPALPRCYNCGIRGHVASGCRSPRQRGTTPQRDAGPRHKLHHHNPASRGTPHVWPTHTPVTHSNTAAKGGPISRTMAPTRTALGTHIEPSQWSVLAHRVVAASSGSSAVVGHIDGVEGKTNLADHVKFNLDKLTEARDAAMQNSDLRQKANERLRLSRAHMLQWKPGDKAWLHCPQVPLATSSKLVRPWRGPVEVVEVLRPQCVRINETPATRRRRQVETSGRPCDVTALPRGGATARQQQRQQQRQQWHLAGGARCGLWVASGWFGFPLTATVSGERKLLKRRLAGPPLRRLSLKVRTSRGVSTSAVAAAVGGDRGGAWPTAVTFCGVHGAASSRARPCCC
ncbi:unnamed protein product [Lampetra fluviatilis]